VADFYIIAIVVPMPERAKEKFFDLVPLYPKRKYAVILYLMAGIIYGLMSIEGAKGILFSLLSVIIASQITKGIAKLRKEDLEESHEEEMERKRKMAP
jgi:hypothetical protein